MCVYFFNYGKHLLRLSLCCPLKTEKNEKKMTRRPPVLIKCRKSGVKCKVFFMVWISYTSLTKCTYKYNIISHGVEYSLLR